MAPSGAADRSLWPGGTVLPGTSSRGQVSDVRHPGGTGCGRKDDAVLLCSGEGDDAGVHKDTPSSIERQRLRGGRGANGRVSSTYLLDRDRQQDARRLHPRRVRRDNGTQFVPADNVSLEPAQSGPSLEGSKGILGQAGHGEEPRA